MNLPQRPSSSPSGVSATQLEDNRKAAGGDGVKKR